MTRVWRIVAIVTLAFAPERQATRPTFDSSVQMLEAGITEGPPFDPNRMADRAVTFRVVAAGRPACTGSEASPRYMFLLDARPWLAGGVVLDGVPEIRVQAKIEMACDPASRQYVLSVNGAPVVVSPVAAPDGAFALEAGARLADLPAVEFQWVALSTDGAGFRRIPGRGRTGLWRIRERVLR